MITYRSSVVQEGKILPEELPSCTGRIFHSLSHEAKKLEGEGLLEDKNLLLGTLHDLRKIIRFRKRPTLNYKFTHSGQSHALAEMLQCCPNCIEEFS
jgi:hypothetical protein